MKNIEAIIFDMDGTLYRFDHSNESNFGTSQFGQQIYENCIRFFQQRFQLDRSTAEKMFQDLKARYNGAVSLAVEQERGINRSEYFAATWDLEPSQFMQTNQKLVETLSVLTVKTGILTAAPRVWADRVLNFLKVRQLFEPAVFTGDPDIRKPNPLAFQQLATFWSLLPGQIISIGDQETTDILPAKSLGMTTVRIGKEVPTEADFLAEDIFQALALLKKEGVI